MATKKFVKNLGLSNHYKRSAYLGEVASNSIRVRWGKESCVARLSSCTHKHTQTDKQTKPHTKKSIHCTIL